MLDLSKLRPPVSKGDKPLTAAKFQRLVSGSLRRILPDPLPTQLTLSQFETAKAMNAHMLGLQMQAQVNNVFNHQLVAYREALARLQQVEKSKGRKEETALVETGEYDEEGEPVTVSQVIVTAIEALSAEVKIEEYNEETGKTKTKSVKNPEIEKDEAERAQAQAIVDSMPDEVKDFNG